MAILKEIVKQQNTHIGSLMSTATRQDAQLKSQDAQLKSQDAQLKSHDAQLKSQDALLKAQNAQLKAQDAQLKAQDTQLKSHDAQLKSKDEQLKAHGTQLKSQGAQLKAQDTLLKSQDALAKSQDAHLKAKDAQLKAQTQHIANLQKAVDRHESTIAQLKHEIGGQSHDAEQSSADQPNPNSMHSEVHFNVSSRRSQGYIYLFPFRVKTTSNPPNLKMSTSIKTNFI